MKEIKPNLEDIARTENKNWQTPKVLNLLRLLLGGNDKFTEEPVYLIKNDGMFFGDKEYFVYDGNTLHFLAESGMTTIKYKLIENNNDLEQVREEMGEVYWPGPCIQSVMGYLRTRVWVLGQGDHQNSYERVVYEGETLSSN
jgi:hypothetical protein